MDQQLALNNCLEKIGRFTPEEAEQILFHCTHKDAKKGEQLLRPGTICNWVGFLIDGTCYQCKSYEDAETIIELYSPFDCVVNPSSFFFQKPSEEAIKAYNNCSLLMLSIQALHELIALSPAYFQLATILQPGWFRVSFYDQGMSPSEKYIHLLNSKPHIVQTFPLKMIASYLKITPETLSRVRATM